ncbi:MAG TPA: nuclear transport factor 2 family protein [Pyrinomonadaceae bacterium]|nr:nuclear transport factor 2 family protein [Pyrinomonadaceae bacterium]
MGADENKELIKSIFDELAKGDSRPFIESMADDFSWTVTGTTKWSRTYQDKQAVMSELLGPLATQFATQYKNFADHLIAEGDYVVVECRGEVMTKSGKPYNNTYCWVCRLSDGKLKHLTEYMDTELVTRTFSDVL